jgi:uncharacterized protein YceK
MKKAVIVLLVAASLAGCGSVNHTLAQIKGYQKVCVGGVEYYQFPHGAVVAYNRSGQVIPCN